MSNWVFTDPGMRWERKYYLDLHLHRYDVCSFKKRWEKSYTHLRFFFFLFHTCQKKWLFALYVSLTLPFNTKTRLTLYKMNRQSFRSAATKDLKVVS